MNYVVVLVVVVGGWLLLTKVVFRWFSVRTSGSKGCAARRRDTSGEPGGR